MSAVGAPVVASHVYPYKGSAMKHGENCLFARNSADWVKYMSRLIEDKDYREELNKNAIEEIRKNHTIDTMKEKWRDFFLKL